MYIYMAAFSLKPLTGDDFFFVLSHHHSTGKANGGDSLAFDGDINMAVMRSPKGVYSYLFQGIDKNIETDNVPVVILSSHTEVARSIESNAAMLIKHERAITKFAETIKRFAEPKSEHCYATSNGNFVTMLEGVNMEKLADIFLTTEKA